jgi:hypothetical protein
VAVSVELARQQWEDGYRRFRAESQDRLSRAALLAQVEVVTLELRRRVGATFSLAHLADTYADADRWATDAMAEHASSPGWAGFATTATDAAFHLYARGAVDYRP